MRVLVACEYGGRTREAFRRLGHDAWSCDLLPAEDNSKHHHQCDVRDVLRDYWDLMIAHPECTFLCASGMHWTTRGHRDPALTENAIEFVKTLMNAPIGRIAIENPVGILSKRVRKPDQIIQPYEYGDDASKRTCLWLKNLSLLRPTEYIEPRWVCCGRTLPDFGGCPNCIGENKPLPRWGNQTDSGQNKLTPSADRWKDRSCTYQGWSEAMALQWGGIVMGGKTYHDWASVIADFDALSSVECEL